jgi:hypothetical protein
LNILQFIKGNAVDFGDLTQVKKQHLGACHQSTRGIFGGGYTPTANKYN